MKIGVVQLNSRLDKMANISNAEKHIDELATSGCELIILPEYFNFLGPQSLEYENAESINGITVERIAKKALQHGVYIHLGSFLEKDEANVFNTSLVFDKKGEIYAKYRKIHLFDVNNPGTIVQMESDVITAGEEIVTFKINDIVFGMATCYDLRFPELFRKLSEAGAMAFILPGAFHLHTGKDHWEVLLRARAIENLAYMIAPDQWKGIKEHVCFGRSMIINPWGIIKAQADDCECNIIVEIDSESVNKARKDLPALEHRRRDIFEG
jgi:predicted amidohydrolase